jgi:predicted dinucleotide-binding enzyme
MTLTVAIIAPGNMGAAVGGRLTENKVNVLTSPAAAKRARPAQKRPA